MCKFLKSPDNDIDKQEIQRLQNRVTAEAFVSSYLYGLINNSEKRQSLLDANEIWQMLIEARKTDDYTQLIKLTF